MLVTSTTQGRTITINNISSFSVGCCGRVLKPGTSTTVKLTSVQGSNDHMNELDRLVKQGHITVDLNGLSLLHGVGIVGGPTQPKQVGAGLMERGGDLATLDAALSGDLRFVRDVFTLPVALDTNGYKTAAVAPAVATTYLGSNFNGAIGQGSVDFARNVTITGICAGGETLAQKTAVIVGYDIEGVLRSESLIVSTGGQVGINTTTYVGVQAFKKLFSVYLPAEAGGAPGDYEIGFGDVLGLSKPMSQGGLLAEFINNAPAGVAGTWVVSGTSAPNGTYIPNAALIPNGARTYIVAYVPGT